MIGVPADLLERLAAELPAAVALRHELHRHPDLSGDESATRDRVLHALDGAGPAQPVARTGAVLRIGGPGPAVAVRAELDALPVTETTGLAWASQRPGAMHACGHDVHLAAAVALARAVAAVERPSPLLVVLQPREEAAPSGAQDVVVSGVLEREPVCAVVGAHVQPALPVGTVACTGGAVNASNDEFTVVVEGEGGHAAYPHRSVDPVVALSHVVLALQSIISRGTDPLRSAVVSVTMLSAGPAVNVIPARATAQGTVRALDAGTRRSTHAAMRSTVSLVARAHGCRGRLEVVEGEPVLVNDAALALRTGPLLQQLGCEVDADHRSMGADDFAYFCDAVPSLMLFVGTGGPQLHTSGFAPADEDVDRVARAMLAGYLAASRRST